MGNIILLEENNQDKILRYMPEEKMLENLSCLFSAFSDSTRLKILTALSMTPMCVNDISVLLGINQTTVSHQLKTLKALNLVEFSRSGKIIEYKLSGNVVSNVMLNGVNHLLEAE